MEHYLLIFRSVTQAQRAERLLANAGIRSRIFRTPMELTAGYGCSYAMRVAAESLQQAMTVIRAGALTPAQIYRSGKTGYEEAAL